MNCYKIIIKPPWWAFWRLVAWWRWNFPQGGKWNKCEGYQEAVDALPDPITRPTVLLTSGMFTDAPTINCKVKEGAFLLLDGQMKTTFCGKLTLGQIFERGKDD
jgi:hypothetical protein